MPTIALVDDDRNILTSVSIALEAEGYRVQTYTDGAAALADRDNLAVTQGEKIFKKGESTDLKAETMKPTDGVEPKPSAQVPLDTAAGVAISNQPNLAIDQGNRVFSKGESDRVLYNRVVSPNSERTEFGDTTRL